MKCRHWLLASIIVSVGGTVIAAPMTIVVAVSCTLYIIAHTAKDAGMV